MELAFQVGNDNGQFTMNNTRKTLARSNKWSLTYAKCSLTTNNDVNNMFCNLIKQLSYSVFFHSVMRQVSAGFIGYSFTRRLECFRDVGVIDTSIFTLGLPEKTFVHTTEHTVTLTSSHWNIRQLQLLFHRSMWLMESYHRKKKHLNKVTIE